MQNEAIIKLGEMSIKQAAAFPHGGSCSVKASSAVIANLFKLIDGKKKNRIMPHRLGRKIEKRASALGDAVGKFGPGLAGAGIGAGVGALAGGLSTSEDKKKNTWLGAGFGALGGLAIGSQYNKTPSTLATTPARSVQSSPPNAESINSEQKPSLLSTAKANPISFTGNVANYLGLLSSAASKIPYLNKVPGLTGLAGAVNRFTPGLNEASNYRLNPDDTMANSQHRVTDIFNWDKSNNGVNLSNGLHAINNPYILSEASGNPAYIAANTASDMVSGLRSDYAHGDPGKTLPIRVLSGLNNNINTQMGIQAPDPVGNGNVLVAALRDGIQNNANRGVSKDIFTSAGATAKNLIQNPPWAARQYATGATHAAPNSHMNTVEDRIRWANADQQLRQQMAE